MHRSLKGLKVQLRVIAALLMREILTRYGRHNIGFLWLFVEPMLFTAGITALWSFAHFHAKSPVPIAAFAVTGYSSVLLWRNMPGRCVHAIEPNLSLMYHKNVKVIDIFISRLILEAAGATTSFMVLATVFTLLGWMDPPYDIVVVLLGWVMLAWFGASLALVLGGLGVHSELVEKLWHPAAYLIFPLSGAAFMVDWLPPSAQEVVLWIPTVHGTELVRAGYFGPILHTHYDVSYLAGCSLLLTALGLALERIAAKKIVPQ